MTSTTLSRLRPGRRTSTSARRTRAATRRPSASRRSSRAASASARVQFVDGKFDTNGAKSTIEVVNLMLGKGNDSLDIQGTLDPDDAVKLTGTIVITPRRRRGIGDARPAPQPFDWKAQGFLVGQPVHDLRHRAARGPSLGFADDNLADTTDNTLMHLERPVLTPARSPLRRSTSSSRSSLTSPRRRRRDGGTSRAPPATGSRTASSSARRSDRRRHRHWRIDAITNGDKTLVLGDGPALASAGAATRTCGRRADRHRRRRAGDGRPSRSRSSAATRRLVTRTDGRLGHRGFIAASSCMIQRHRAARWRLLGDLGRAARR